MTLRQKKKKMKKKKNILPLIKSDGSKALFLIGSAVKGETIHELNGYYLKNRNKYSIETDDGHVMDELFQYCNHSFEPNISICKKTKGIAALRDIEDEELVFNYYETESEISHKFKDLLTKKIVG